MKKFWYIFLLFAFTSSLYAQEIKKPVDIKKAKSMQEAGVYTKPNTILNIDLLDYLNEGFEGGVVPPTGWTAIINNAGFTWKINNLTPYSGLYNADVEYDPAVVPQDEFLISPSIDLSSVIGSLVIRFYWNTSYYWFVSPNNNGDVFLKISSDGGTTWTSLWSEDSVGVFTNWTWYEQVLDISAYVGQSNVKIAFNYIGVDAAQFSLDEISLYSIAGPGAASNPNPADGVFGVPITASEATWDNPAGATSNEFWFGTDPGSLTILQSGSLATSFSIPPGTLSYNTNYYWRVDEIDGTGTTTGPVWSFKTERDPSVYFEDFEAGLGSWTITNNGGTCDWAIDLASAYSMPITSEGNVAAANSDGCGSGSTMNTTLSQTSGVDLSMYSDAFLEFDSDFNDYLATDDGYVDISVDNGATWTNVLHYDGIDVRATHVNLDISTLAGGQSDVRVRFTYTAPGWDWWWAIDNVSIYGVTVIPVELTSFAAVTDNRNVTLNWSTATELNNSGFQVERSSGSAYEVVGFVAGSGTTTEIRNYNFVDQNVASGTYSYRLKQVDFDGTFEYSNAIEVEVVGVKEFALGQNYPNPFNPSTTINFSLAVDSKVSLKIFDVLGQEVATLINGQMAAGSQKVSFDASSLNSGVYFYRIDASGVDGQKFSSVKKMILTK